MVARYGVEMEMGPSEGQGPVRRTGNDEGPPRKSIVQWEGDCAGVGLYPACGLAQQLRTRYVCICGAGLKRSHSEMPDSRARVYKVESSETRLWARVQGAVSATSPESVPSARTEANDNSARMNGGSSSRYGSERVRGGPRRRCLSSETETVRM